MVLKYEEAEEPTKAVKKSEIKKEEKSSSDDIEIL